ncbi:galactan 5-O-arabinofuranosyltransferase [Williamsia limnetica]|jgi:galactan 5-O-arabinofuranosyltransferase|uniref:Galactan 5-O-arabinofuranosyltransferase n=1 Tax=Williamsia limnetica TaxID=882452 RepID=A0A318RNR3_WILLI|nr:galactan 5-O-arabinofuranosyltransferase [Williamsia limnetica]PYE18462.1 galactan 5-O-arabinofuranosyltransferase [Williamsia limnetica]
MPKHLSALGNLIGAAIVALVVAGAGLAVIARVDWPAFNSSNVETALTTTGQVVAIALLLIAVVLSRTGKAVWAIKPLSWVGISAFAAVTLAMPLGATKLYLFGISVDQQFRTEYLTRLTNSPHLADMTYADLPPYYPAGWFWLGGRYASLTGQPGWEAFKPWAIISIAVAAAIAMALWQRMIRTDRAIAVSLASTVLTLMYVSPEPYAAVLVILGAPMLITILHGLRSGSRPAIVAGGLFLGLSATFYTLYTGLYALTAVLMAAYLAMSAWFELSNKATQPSAIRSRRWRAVLVHAARLVAMAVVAGLVALIVWAPYLWARLQNKPASGGTAEHYLPSSGAVLPTPMLHWSLIGALTMVGLVWIVLRFRTRTVALTFGITVFAIYLFCLLSMALTAMGTTLLSFRMEPVLVVVLGVAGVYGFAELAAVAVRRFGDVRTVVGVLAAGAAIAVAQSIPSHLAAEITVAYTDTDGYGVRADQRPPGAQSYFPEISAAIGEQTGGRPQDDVVVLTADYGFLSIYPYLGFQGLTSHYANPLAEFDKRAATIETWSQAQTADSLIEQLDAAPWRPPTVFLFRYSPEGYDLRLAEDVYPNDPNVRRYTVTFNQNVFDDPRFTVTNIGPFVLVVRN